MGLFGKSDPEPAIVAGVTLRCEICKFDHFHHRNAQLHGAVASFFDLEWTGPRADCYVCAQCGYIHWFLPVD
jgi:hypothetical protein